MCEKLCIYLSLSPSKEKHRLKMFWNEMVNRIFESKGEEVTGRWRKLQYEELHIFYLSTNSISDRIKENLDGRTARMGI
jgi:hypothetical protein